MPRHIKPTSILKMEKGKLYDEQRDRAELEPKPREDLRPACPGYFTKGQRAEWEFFERVLDNYGLFTAANATYLEMLCVNMAEYRTAAKAVVKNGIMIKEGKRYVYNPFWPVLNKLEDKIRKYLNELGLSSIGLAKIGQYAMKSRKRQRGGEDLLS